MSFRCALLSQPFLYTTYLAQVVTFVGFPVHWSTVSAWQFMAEPPAPVGEGEASPNPLQRLAKAWDNQTFSFEKRTIAEMAE